MTVDRRLEFRRDCAFTAAWNRPDAFRRVLSFIGSYTNLRGGQIYSSLIRKTEPKPLRVFLQDGKATRTSTPVTGGQAIRTWPPPWSMQGMTQHSS